MMKVKRKNFSNTVLFAALFVMSLLTIQLGMFFLTTKTARAEDPSYTIFVSATCPHCHNVKDWIAENNLGEKVELIEVADDENAQQQMLASQRSHGVPQNQVGSVPYMPVGDDDYKSGDAPIIVYIAQAEGIDAGEWANKVQPDDHENKNDTAETQLSTQDLLILLIGRSVVVFVVGFGVYRAFNG